MDILIQQRHRARNIRVLGSAARDFIIARFAHLRLLAAAGREAVVRWNRRHEYWPWFAIMALLAAAYLWALLSSAGPFWH